MWLPRLPHARGGVSDFAEAEAQSKVVFPTPVGVWRQLSCPVRVNYPGRFLLKNGLLY